MKKTLAMVLCSMALAFAGCGGGDAPKTGCDGIGTKIKEMAKKEEAEAMKEMEGKDMPPEAKKMMEKYKGVMNDMMNDMAKAAVASCKEDKWPEDVVKCFNEAKGEEDMDKCKEMGGEELNKKMEARIEAIEEKYKDKLPGGGM
jgi:hypothetical protein